MALLLLLPPPVKMLSVVIIILGTCLLILVYIIQRPWASADTGRTAILYNDIDKHGYAPSAYYSENTFPLKINLINTGNIIPYLNETLTLAAEEINKRCNYDVFETVCTRGPRHRTEKSMCVNVVSYVHEEYHESFDGPGQVLAHATLPPFKILCIDFSETWTADLLYCTVLHEMGHILGLIHNSDAKSIMYLYRTRDTTYTDDDVENIYNIYPFMRPSAADKKSIN